MAAIGTSSVSDGPVLSVINKRLRALRKKYNRILQMEESLSQGKILNKEQEETLRSKSSVMGCINELEKLKTPVCAALDKELKELEVEKFFSMVEDVIKLLYFAVIFTLPRKSDSSATRSASPSERDRCLAYTNVNNANAPEVVSEMDLNLISMLGCLIISRPTNSSLSHQNALRLCFEHARLWLAKSDQPIGSDPHMTYSGLREKLNKIMASDYFTTTPEMKAPVEVAAAAAGSYGSFHAPVHGSMVPVDMPVQMEGSMVQYEQKDDETANAEETESHDNQSSPVEEFHQGDESENYSELPGQIEPATQQVDMGQHLHELESKEQHYAPRRSYQNSRGRGVGASGRRGYPNGRGGRGSSRGGAYQNGRNQYYDQPGSYYPRNNYYRGRGGRGYSGSYNYHADQAGYVVADS